MIDKLDEILIEMCKGNSNCAGSDNCLNCEQGNIKQAKTAILNWVKERRIKCPVVDSGEAWRIK